MRTHHPGKAPAVDRPVRTVKPAADLHATISRSAVGNVPGGRGQPLAAPVTEGMGARLGGDFSRVPIYSGSAARAAAADALVSTSGSHAVVGDGSAGTHILALQRSIGNAAVSRMLGQARHAPAAVQRSAVHDVLRAPGQPLSAPVKEEMEARFGANFSQVRVHTDDAARASVAAVGARAYTSGNHVVIEPGAADRRTLAHELAHVIQQRQGPVSGTDDGSGLSLSDPSDRFERVAEATAERALRGTLRRPENAGEASSASPADRRALQGGPSTPGGLPNVARLQRSIGCHTDAAGQPQFQIDNVRPPWTGLAAGIATGINQQIAHIIAFEVIQNDLANILNSMLAARGTPNFPGQSQRLIDLCDALFNYAVAPAVAPAFALEQANMVTNRTNLINAISNSPPGPLNPAQRTPLTNLVDVLLRDLNSCFPNLRVGNAAANQSIGYSIDAEFLPGTYWYTTGLVLTNGAAPAASQVPAAVPPANIINGIQGPATGPGVVGFQQIMVGSPPAAAAGTWGIECLRLTPEHESKVYQYQTHSTLGLSFVTSGTGGGALFPQFIGVGPAMAGPPSAGTHLSSTQMPTAHRNPPFPVLVRGGAVPFLFQ